MKTKLSKAMTTSALRSQRRKKLKNKLDKLWSEAVKVINCHQCILCGASRKRCKNYPYGSLGGKVLNSHHIEGKSTLRLRYSLLNGISLCTHCHTFGYRDPTKLCAHKGPKAFKEHMEKKMGDNWEHLQEIKRDNRKMTNEELEELVEKYKLLIDNAN